jgi:hypothetical protein
MYKNYRQNRTEYLKLLNEGSVNPLNLDTKSNPALDIYNWDGKDELPTTIKSADLDEVIKKIANKEGESGLNKTDIFENAYNKVFGSGSNGFSPYDDISDTDYKETLLNSYKGYISEDFEEKEKEESKDDSKDLSMELEDIKSTEKYDGEEEDEDDDDDDDDEDSLKEAYMGLNLDENMGSDLDDVVSNYVSESEDYEDVSPISLLEDSDDSIFNLNSLLEQTQAIEDEVDSILSFNESEKFSNIMNDSEVRDILEESSDDYLLESDFSDDDFSEYLDEDLM